MAKSSDQATTSSWLTHNRKLLTYIAIGIVAGFLLLAVIRFFVAKPAVETHYHANFKVFINGQQEQFKGPGYYQEVAACTDHTSDDPKLRTHMHDQINDVVHVHDKRVTWQAFFENLGWSIGPGYIHTDTTLLSNSPEKQVTYILNGQKVTQVDNRVIGDQDKLLVSYDVPGADVMAQYNQIENKAREKDMTTDPATCSGLNGGHENSFGARLKRAFFGT